LLLACDRRAAGFALFVQGPARFDYKLAGRQTILRVDPALPRGEHELGCTVLVGADAVVARLLLDREEIAAEPLPQSLPAGFGVMSTQCGLNSPSPVSSCHEAPFRFSRTLHELVVELGAGVGRRRT
jgi:hypothetical protein